MTEQQYNNLLNGFSKDTINTMTQEMIDLFKDEIGIKTESVTKYLKTNYKNIGYKIPIMTEEEISEDQWMEETSKNVNESKSINSNGGEYAIHETTYKKITLSATYVNTSMKSITLTNVWKSTPVNKSYDVLAIAPQTLAATIGSNYRSGYQKYDGTVMNYSSTSQNWKVVSGTGIFKKGIGLSQNLLDSATSFENSMTVIFAVPSDSFLVKGTYQHAQGDVSLLNSQAYTFEPNNYYSMGGFLYYSDSTIRNIYDHTGGLEITLSSSSIS